MSPSRQAAGLNRRDLKMNTSPELQNSLAEHVKQRQAGLVSITRDLIRIPSENKPPHGSERACQTWIAERLTTCGLEPDIYSLDEVAELERHPLFWPGRDYTDRPNLAARRTGAGGGRSLLLSGHIDTVPRGTQNWTHDAFGGTVQGNRIFGRGSNDMKAGIATNLFVVECLAELGLSLRGDLLFETVIDEEFGGCNGTLAGRLRGYNADAAILAEPTSLRICPAQRGGRTAHITFHANAGGVLQNGHFPAGITPQLTCFLSKLPSFAAQRRSTVRVHEMYAKHADPVPVSVTKISTSPWGFDEPITIPETAQLELYWQLMPGETQPDVEREFFSWLKQLTDAEPKIFPTMPQVTFPMRWMPGSSIGPNEPVVQGLSECAAAVLGAAPIVAGIEGPCDLFVFQQGFGIPTVLWGPRGGNTHAADEYVEIDSIVSAAQALLLFVVEWCGISKLAQRLMFALVLFVSLFGSAPTVSAQIYSPKLLRAGQPDSTDLKKFAVAIYLQAGAHTPRQKAEAIWRFFLTDGRFVKPGFWYHIAGWTYEEPSGEVLDPIKLINSYGFGLCYHIAPLLEAVFEAGGFADARCWFLTGHTVAEVFYEGAYHYFDSDMMGYNVAGDGPFQGKSVASVRDLQSDSNIILGKLAGPDKVNPQVVDDPWYPADVRAKAMDELSKLFTTIEDNYLYPYSRYSPGHRMDFVLRPGEKITRFFEPEEPGLFYLPYKFDGKNWTEFPQEFSEFHIRTVDGPRSQKDNRLWATGRIEYTPRSIEDRAVTVIEMPSPYVIIDAQFTIDAELPSRSSSVRVETSTDRGRHWLSAGELSGPHRGSWTTQPKVLVKSAHGRLTPVSGSYGYMVRIARSETSGCRINSVHLLSRVQLNPRTLPTIQSGENNLVYSSAMPLRRVPIPSPLMGAPKSDFEVVDQDGQAFLRPVAGKTGRSVYTIDVDNKELSGFDAGARFLDLKNRLAPNKLTAETRPVSLPTHPGEASIAWSASPEGPFLPLWNYPGKIDWRDGKTVDRVLLWPEVFRQVRVLPAGTRRVYVEFRSSGPALDSLRLAVYVKDDPPRGRLAITQTWLENGKRQEHVERLEAGIRDRQFTIKAGPNVRNEAIAMEAE